MRSLCVFCGSSPGRSPGFLELATSFGALVARRGITLVYGGGKVGLMGALADGALAAGGEVVGVIPGHLLAKEVGHAGLHELIVVDTMQERKARMAELSEASVALPGGLGTLDELFEVWTWHQLGLSRDPIGILDFEGFFDSLLAFLDHASESGFIRPVHRQTLLVERDAERLLDRLAAAVPTPSS